MKQILDLPIFVGRKEEVEEAIQAGMRIVCAMDRAKDHPSHQSVVGWWGKSCNKDHPHYFYKKVGNDLIALNLIDGDNWKKVSHEVIEAALSFIHESVEDGYQVFIYCSEGQSRSPSLALMYLVKHGHLKIEPRILPKFKENIYPDFNPSRGMEGYLIYKVFMSPSL